MKTHLNLLPQKFRRWQVVRQRLLHWSLVWAVAVTAAAGVYWRKHSRYESRLAQMQAREAEFTPLGKLQSEAAAVRAKIEDLNTRESLALQLADEEPALLILGIVSRAARDCAGEISVQRLSLVRRAAAGANRRDASADAPPQKQLTLQGLGASDLSVARFVACLRDAQVFDQVELKSAGTQKTGEINARFYYVECAF